MHVNNMKNLSTILLEKLRINKETKIRDDYMFMMFFDTSGEKGVDYTICATYEEAEKVKKQKNYLCGYYCPQNLLKELGDKLTSNPSTTEEYKEIDKWIADNEIIEFENSDPRQFKK